MFQLNVPICSRFTFTDVSLLGVRANDSMAPEWCPSVFNSIRGLPKMLTGVMRGTQKRGLFMTAIRTEALVLPWEQFE